VGAKGIRDRASDTVRRKAGARDAFREREVVPNVVWITEGYKPYDFLEIWSIGLIEALKRFVCNDCSLTR
jgi:hypothetical protein